jgi:hypothetical protein
LIRNEGTLTGALKVYAETWETLGKNPLHRAVAYYDSPGGRVGLYEYCGLQINALGEGVSFDSLPSAVVQQGESFTQTIKLSSRTVREIGSALCRVRLVGNNNGSPDVVYPVGRNNSFVLQIHTARLEPGNYAVQLEILLNEIAAPLRQNPRGGFSLEVKPLNTVRFLYQDTEALVLGSTIQGIFRNQGILPVQSGGAYLAIIRLDLKERKTADYYYIQPVITISVELERDRTPVLNYTKQYDEFAHRSRDAALDRAYRNIQADLDRGFAGEIRSLEK